MRDNKVTDNEREIIKETIKEMLFWFEVNYIVNDGPQLEDILEQMVVDIKSQNSCTCKVEQAQSFCTKKCNNK